MKAADITSDIRDAFKRNVLLDANKIHIKPNGNKVILHGKVSNYAEMDESEQVAWSALGANSVDNQHIRWRNNMSITEYDNTDEQVIGSGWITAIAIVMIVLGIIAIAFPFFATIASTVLFGWVFTLLELPKLLMPFNREARVKSLGK
ncbi:BON domain-containing protein [Pseudanabaena galeata UHCC 0370]|uniref:BON domain-containing protein n=1 Tax=Pseudanabaena galeata UHCC 0370 TaxID=3110310 RepID=A0ABU5TPM3_9CYAN|nr:BON domain-containing protein [Pseudanabaena galeata]MEA5480219.1 BON domain-containing protein [Pseudanabaena galeata UHCC 0370]